MTTTPHSPETELTIEETVAADNPMAQAISVLLIGGVIISAIILIIGLAMLFITGSTGYNQPLTDKLLRGPQGYAQYSTTIGGVVRNAFAGRPFAIIELGALVLIATPVLRVGASIFLFLAEHDRLYALITLGVFVLLIVSIFFVSGSGS